MKRKKKKTSTTRADDPARKGNSRYFRKHAYLKKTGLHGTQIPNPKPWK